MADYAIITDSIAAAYRASGILDGIMDTESGPLAVIYRLKGGEPLPFIDTGYLNPRGIQRARRRIARAHGILTPLHDQQPRRRATEAAGGPIA